MSDRTNRLFLEDIVEAIGKIERYIGSLDYDRFIRDDKTVDAVVRNLEIIGEASKNVSDEIKAKHPEVPWKRMSGLRNIIAHEYFGIDLKIVWKIVKENLPEVMPHIKSMLENIES